VSITDEIISVSQLLGASARAAPKVYTYGSNCGGGRSRNSSINYDDNNSTRVDTTDTGNR